MLSPENSSPRPWRVIAQEAAREQDAQKLIVLVEELNRALDAQRSKPPGGESAKDIPAA
jgi:hypothetical protein